EKQPPRMLHVTSSHLRSGSMPPKQIDTSRARNGAPSVVIEDKTRRWPPGGNFSAGIKHWLLYLDESQPPWRKETLIRRHRTARHQEHAKIPLRALRHRTEKDIARIAVQDACDLLRVVMKIAA